MITAFSMVLYHYDSLLFSFGMWHKCQLSVFPETVESCFLWFFYFEQPCAFNEDKCNKMSSYGCVIMV
jgi:hypothetical protein